MLAYFVKRLLAALPIALAVTRCVSRWCYLAPGDPLSAVLPSDASQETVDIVKKQYGLDKPVPVQYLIWLQRAVTGDLGRSISSGRPVAEEIGKAIGNSLLLAGLASVLAFSVGGGLGIAAGYRNGSGADRAMSALAIAGVSIPHYWLGIVLVAIFSARLNWLPAMGAGPATARATGIWTMCNTSCCRC
jgi:peptide/nickel transport system permease protein